MSDSPFAFLGDALPPALRLQLLAEAPVVLEGRMDVVWRRRRWLRPLFSALSLFDMLFPETGRDVPCRLAIASTPGGRSWRRSFAFARERRFDAVVAWDDGRSRVVERFGRLELDWDVRFEPPGRLEIRTGSAAVRFGRARIPVPRLLTPDVCAVEHAVGPAAVRVDLVLSHRLLGPLFGYGGTFEVRPA